MSEHESPLEFRRLMVPDRDKCEELIDTITDALGYVEVGRGDREYTQAKKAVAEIRAILAMDDEGDA